MEKTNTDIKKNKKIKKKSKRCCEKYCKKKLSLVDLTIKCKCNKSFCPKHRPYTQHNCQYKINNNNLQKGLGGGNFKQIEVI